MSKGSIFVIMLPPISTAMDELPVWTCIWQRLESRSPYSGPRVQNSNIAALKEGCETIRDVIDAVASLLQGLPSLGLVPSAAIPFSLLYYPTNVKEEAAAWVTAQRLVARRMMEYINSSGRGFDNS